MAIGTGRFSWSVAGAELSVIVAGVLLALAADGWNDDRRAQEEEGEYLERLSTELAEDTAKHSYIIGAVQEKRASLDRIASALASDVPTVRDTLAFLSDLGDASNFGWNVGPLAEDATYEDLRSSGQLGLVRDPQLRLQIIKYYGTAEAEDLRMIARGTRYPHLAYMLVPQGSALRAGPFGGVERPDSSRAAEVLRAVWESDLAEHIIAETNRAIFIEGSITRLRERATSLLVAIHSYTEGSM